MRDCAQSRRPPTRAHHTREIISTARLRTHLARRLGANWRQRTSTDNECIFCLSTRALTVAGPFKGQRLLRFSRDKKKDADRARGPPAGVDAHCRRAASSFPLLPYGVHLKGYSDNYDVRSDKQNKWNDELPHRNDPYSELTGCLSTMRVQFSAQKCRLATGTRFKGNCSEIGKAYRRVMKTFLTAAFKPFATVSIGGAARSRLHFLPMRASPRPVRQILALGDDAFKAVFFGRAEQCNWIVEGLGFLDNL